jgi:hypothetical protein
VGLAKVGAEGSNHFARSNFCHIYQIYMRSSARAVRLGRAGYHPQLLELAELARAFPQTTIILNHFGGPLGIGPYAAKRDETFVQWKAGIAELGKCQNVVVKLGGLGMLFGMFDFHTRETPPSSEELARAYKPYIETCIAACGPDRGMFESNFPPDSVSSPRAVERLQTPGGRFLSRRQGEVVQRHGGARLPSRVDFIAIRGVVPSGRDSSCYIAVAHLFTLPSISPITISPAG